MKNTIVGQMLQTTWISIFRLLWDNPYFTGVLAAVTLIMQEFVVYLISVLLMVLGDAILGAMAAGKDFDFGILFKKTLFKIISYTVGIMAAFILVYFPFNGDKNDFFGYVKNLLFMLMIANEYVSIVKNGKKMGVKLGPTFLIKGIKAADKTGRLNAAN